MSNVQKIPQSGHTDTDIGNGGALTTHCRLLLLLETLSSQVKRRTVEYVFEMFLNFSAAAAFVRAKILSCFVRFTIARCSSSFFASKTK